MTTREQNRVASLRYYRRKARRFLGLGLNSRGKVYRRTPPVPRRERPARARARNLASYHRRAERFRRQGLNSRGLAPVRADVTAARRLTVMLGNFKSGRRSLAVIKA